MDEGKFNLTSVKKPNVNDLNEYYKDIKIEPYGCFKNIDEKFFQKQINPYDGKTDSMYVVKQNENEIDIKNLLIKVINNGYDIYGYNIIDKYKKGYKHITIQEIAILGKLAGYNYLTIFKINLEERGTVYLTYSPPMDDNLPLNFTEEQYKNNLSKADFKYTLTPKVNEYTNEIDKIEGKELSCGYPCFSEGDPQTFTDDKGKQRQYMCGSIGYPNIKSDSKYSVYKIVESI